MIRFGIANETAGIAGVWVTVCVIGVGRARCNETVSVIRVWETV